jgi:hypothetical protein
MMNYATVILGKGVPPIFDELMKILPKRLMRTRKRPNISGYDHKYIEKIGATKNKATVYRISDNGKKKILNYTGNLCESITFGHARQLFTKNAPLVAKLPNRKYPEVLKLLEKVALHYFPDFSYDTITLNHNIQCLPHYDGRNVGESFIIGFGEYTGGELVIEGQEFDIRYKPLLFNGASMKHWSNQWKGDRWSAVYYCKFKPLMNVV